MQIHTIDFLINARQMPLFFKYYIWRIVALLNTSARNFILFLTI